MSLRLAALLICLALPVQAAPDNLALAGRLVSDLGGTDNIARMGAQGAIKTGVIKSPDLYRKVYEQYLKDHRDLIARADAAMAAIYAQVYSADELTGYLAYEESPVGRAILQKQFAANESFFSSNYQPAQLTDEEKAAQTDFYASAQGKAINRKFGQAMGTFLTEVGPYLQQINVGAIEQYCQQGGDCSNMKIIPRASKP